MTVEKLFLAQISSQAMQAAVNIAYFCSIFQGSCIAFAMMAQVSVGRWFGSHSYQSIGPAIWQYIWFSLFTSAITIPASFFLGSWYFSGTEIHCVTLPYFHLMILINFLYPLGAALSCFFSGQGKTKLILLATICSQALKIGISYLLIFGKWGFPPLGLMGGAISTMIAQGGFCLLLFSIFISKENRREFNTLKWNFSWDLFKECIYPGILRGLNRLISFSCWALTARLLVAQGGDFAFALSIGGSLFLFLPCLADALSQAQITIFSQLIGRGNSLAIKQAERLGYLAALSICLLCAIPLLICPIMTYQMLFPTLAVNEAMIREVFFGVFTSFSWFIIGFIPISYILAFKDMTFSLFMGVFSWINGYLLMLFFLEVVHISANQIWLALSLTHASTALLYYLRAKRLTKQLEFQTAP